MGTEVREGAHSCYKCFQVRTSATLRRSPARLVAKYYAFCMCDNFFSLQIYYSTIIIGNVHNGLRNIKGTASMLWDHFNSVAAAAGTATAIYCHLLPAITIYNPTSSVIKKGLPHLKMTRSKCDSCSINGSAAANRSDETSQVSSISKNHSIVAKGREKTIQVPLSECEKCLNAKRNDSALGKRGDTIGPFVTHIVCPECRKHIQLPVSNPEILLTVKTTEIFHRDRLSLLLFTWMQTVEPDQVKLLIMLAISVKIHQKM